MPKQFISFAAVTLAFAGALVPPSTAQAADKPNIIFIVADDHARKAIGAYGNTDIKTPGLDRLAAEGMRFNHALTPNSFCTPARAALLTGKYSHKNGVTHLNQPFDGSQQTFPKLLQQAGYETSLFGKWHLLTQPTGFDHYCVMKMQGMPHDPIVFEPQHKWIPWGKDTRKTYNIGGRQLKGYNMDVITDEAIQWIRKREGSTKPFCLLLHPKPPHEPYKPAARHAKVLEDVTIPEPPTLLDDYKGRTPEAIADFMHSNRIFLKKNLKSLSMEERKAMSRDEATRILYQEYIKGYYRLVMAVDENIVKLLDFLDASSLTEDTLIVYTSDQGFSLGEHGFYNKQWMYEEPLHQPLIVRYPGKVKPSKVHESMVNHVDLAPTLLDFLGLEIPTDMQGYSLKPILEGKAEKVRDASYYHFYRHGKQLPEMVGVRTETHKLIHYPGMEGTYRWEMFDLVNDPDEMNNLAHVEKHAALREKLTKELKGMVNKYEDPVEIRR